MQAMLLFKAHVNQLLDLTNDLPSSDLVLLN